MKNLLTTLLLITTIHSLTHYHFHFSKKTHSSTDQEKLTVIKISGLPSNLSNSIKRQNAEKLTKGKKVEIFIPGEESGDYSKNVVFVCMQDFKVAKSFSEVVRRMMPFSVNVISREDMESQIERINKA